MESTQNSASVGTSMDSVASDLRAALPKIIPPEYRHLVNWCKYAPPPKNDHDHYVIFECEEYRTVLCKYINSSPYAVGRHYDLPWDNIYTHYYKSDMGFAWYSLSPLNCHTPKAEAVHLGSA